MAVAVSALALLLLTAQDASAQHATFTNSTPMSFSAGVPGNPNPSGLSVSGLSGNISNVAVTLTNFSLTSSAFDLMLVSPHGENTMLTSDVISAYNGVTYTFDDTASGSLTNSLLQLLGTFKPTNLGSDSDDMFDGPAGPGGTALSALNGQSPNGTWKLYANDRTLLTPVPIGQIGSWTLDITTLVPELASTPTSKDFGSVTAGESGTAQSFSLSNIGNAALNLTSATLEGPDASSFSLDSNSCTVAVDPTGSCALGVTFRPTSVGTKSATLVVASNALGSPLSIALSGTGVAATVQGDGTTNAIGGTLTQLTPISLVPGENTPGGGASEETNPTGTSQPDSQEITIQQPTFEGGSAPAVGQPTLLNLTASDPKQPISGVIVNFGERQGIFGESACIAGANKGNTTEFSVPYRFLTSGRHTITVTVFAGGCGSPVSRTFAFAIDIPAAKAGYRVRARTAEHVNGPPIKSQCVDNALAPSAKNAKRVVTALLCVMNEQRALYKLKPLKIGKRLGKAALAHTRAMIKGKFFAHQGPRELALVARLKKAKYGSRAAGENIGAGGGDLGSPLGMVDGWMHSKLHRANLLDKNWKYVGIGFLAKFPISGEFPPVATYTTDFGVKP